MGVVEEVVGLQSLYQAPQLLPIQNLALEGRVTCNRQPTNQPMNQLTNVVALDAILEGWSACVVRELDGVDGIHVEPQQLKGEDGRLGAHITLRTEGNR